MLTVGSTDVSFIASQAVARGQQTAEAADGAALDGKVDAMAALERAARAPAGFVAASSGPEGGKKTAEKEAGAPVNPDAIEVDMDDI
jgi:pre-mRNA-splicing factor SYF1